MTQKLNETVAEVKFDNLFYANDPAANTDGVVVASGQGKLTRGTVLAKNTDNKFVALGTKDTEDKVYPANCILCDDLDATSADVGAVAYITGHFNTNALKAKSGYTISDDDKAVLRTNGILLSSAI